MSGQNGQGTSNVKVMAGVVLDDAGRLQIIDGFPPELAQSTLLALTQLVEQVRFKVYKQKLEDDQRVQLAPATALNGVG